MKRSTISSNARSLIGIAVMAVLSLAVIAVSDPLYKALRGPVTTARPEAPLADGSIPMKLWNQTQTASGTEPP